MSSAYFPWYALTAALLLAAVAVLIAALYTTGAGNITTGALGLLIFGALVWLAAHTEEEGRRRG